MMARSFAIVGVSALLVLAFACTKKDDVMKAEADAGSATLAATDASANADRGAGAAGDDVEPVYPIEANAPAVPLAQKLCETLSEMPEKKRAACCNATPGIVVTSECTRMLSAALRHHAVELADGDVTACTTAFDQTLAGCDWVGPFPPDRPPRVSAS